MKKTFDGTEHEERKGDTMETPYPVRTGSTEKITSANKNAERLESAGTANRSVSDAAALESGLGAPQRAEDHITRRFHSQVHSHPREMRTCLNRSQCPDVHKNTNTAKESVVNWGMP